MVRLTGEAAVDGGAIMLKARTPHGDPVELNAEEVKELCEVLMRLVKEIE